MGSAVFMCRPTSEEVTAALDRIMAAKHVRPKHLIVDQGPQFKCEHFENIWCKAQNILPRFGAVGKRGSIAVVERFHRTLKEILRLITLPEDQVQFEREIGQRDPRGESVRRMASSTMSSLVPTSSARKRKTK